jgi:hypothetical protein
MPVLGRQRIRNERRPSLLPGGDPMQPAAMRPNRSTRLWEQDVTEGSLLASVRNAYTSAFDVVDARDGFKADAIKTNRYTPDGLKESLRDFPVAQTAKLKAARNTLAKARDRIGSLERETALPPPDQGEAASRLRDRVWQQLQKLPDGPARDRAILKLAESNPLVAETIREMPRELAGVAATTYDEISNRLAEAMHGPKLAELASLREGVEVAQSAVEAADEDLRSEVGIFNIGDWNVVTEHVKPSAATLWLRKHGDVVHVVDMKSLRTRPATQEQLAAGREFNSLEEYTAANGGVAA